MAVQSARAADVPVEASRPDVAPASVTPVSWREALLAGLLGTLASLLFRGFEGGRWSDIPIFKSFVDTRLYQNDPFIQVLHEGTPAAYTYEFIAGVIRALSGLPQSGQARGTASARPQ